MQQFIFKTGDALLTSAGMAWDVGWSLALGFILSGVIQAVVSQERMREAFGRDGIREIALATAFGASSSSCSYASAAVSRTLFKRGAALVPSLAFLFSSTNLVIELGIILYLLLGWQFTAAEWLGGVVLVAIMAVLVRVTYPTKLIEEARHFTEEGSGHEHAAMPLEGSTIWQKLRNPQLPVQVAQAFVMDVSMLWKDLVVGFLIAGFLSVFVPSSWWSAISLKGSSPWLAVPANAVIGPIVAVLSFVCSIGNVPLAAVLWSSGISFGGVLAFLYADLIVLPLLDAYRRYYGWRMAAYIGTVFFVTMVLSGLLMDVVFTALGLVPSANNNIRTEVTHFSLNYTFWLNLIFGGLTVALITVARRHPMQHGHAHMHHDEHEDHNDASRANEGQS
ncbi:permease [Lichenicoccus sp.]|uniref:permease n=1 Tax=Lichenicoccus sp. TaxID=2781899 RepID=UPI003D117F97